jgi:uncharacterized membrane protein YfcA
VVVLATLFALWPGLAAPADVGVAPDAAPWWIWPLALFVVTLGLGMVAVVGGLGGGTVFVPIVGGFFPFHLDFVRAAGLLVALSGALAAGPHLLRTNLAELRLAMPIALVASAAAIVGARLGLALPTSLLQLALGVLVLGILAVMLRARQSSVPAVEASDVLSRVLGIGGGYREESTGAHVEWRVHRTGTALILFVFIGLLAGMFGIGAGWANVPVLNLVMGAPLKVAVGTSVFLLSITDTSAAWIYLHQGAVLPIVVVPSVTGMMLGSWIGVRILARAEPGLVRKVVLTVLLFAGVRAFLKGAGVWG